MRAATQKLVDQKTTTHFQTLSESDVQQMLGTGASSESPVVRMNIVQIVGCIGTLLTSGSSKSPMTKLVIEFQLMAATKDTDLRVVAEAIDKIIDMFAEDDTDCLCVEVNLLARLKQMLPGLKAKMGMLKKNSKKVDPELKGVINVAKTNLLGFIKYKEKRIGNK